jgi:hypothetical protein
MRNLHNATCVARNIVPQASIGLRQPGTVGQVSGPRPSAVSTTSPLEAIMRGGINLCSTTLKPKAIQWRKQLNTH